MTNRTDLRTPTTLPPELPAPEAVTQSDLEHLRELQVQASEYNKLRKSVLARVTAGAIVASGRLQVRVEQSRSRRFSRKAVEKVLGAIYVQELCLHLEEAVSYRLVINEHAQHPVV